MTAHDPDVPIPPEGIGDAVLAAARAAGMGITIASVEHESAKTIWVSERAAEIFGRPARDIVGRSSFEFIAPEERERLHAQRQARLRGEAIPTMFETVLLTPSGARVPVSVSISYVESRGKRLAVSFVRDVSAEKRAQEALRASDARFRRLMEDAPDGVVISRRGGVLWANDAAARLLGVESGASLIGRSLEEFLDEEGIRTMRARIEHAIKSGERGVPYQYRARHGDGTWVVAEITSHPIEYEGGPAIIAFARDVTARAALQAQLARADRLAALGTLAAGVAHEINNPLTFLTLGMDAVERLLPAVAQSQNEARLRELFAEIRHGATRVATIVRELSAYSRVDDDARGPVDLAEVIAAAERLVAHQLRGRATLSVSVADAPRVFANAGRLEQVFVNLIMNAVQSFPDGSTDNRVSIDARRAPNGDAVVEVRDNGPGIPEDLLGRVFDPFFTTKAPGVGTGLGLTVCHRIVTQLGGTITVENDRGVVVRVTLPPAIEGARPAAPTTEEPSALRRRRLLVIDDEPALVLTVRCLLEQDHEVVTATDGREALTHILKDAAFDLILCDLSMPGLDGADLYEQVRAQRPGLADRFVFMTGGAYTEKTIRFLESTNRPCLHKPFPIAELEAALRNRSLTLPAAG